MPNPRFLAHGPNSSPQRELLSPKFDSRHAGSADPQESVVLYGAETDALVYRAAVTRNDTLYPVHTHAWGEFVCSYTGPIEVQVEGFHFVAPPQFGIWLPPNTEHNGISRAQACHGSFYIRPDLCEGLPQQAALLQVNALTRALLNQLRDASQQPAAATQRLLRVLVDQLVAAEVQGSYLPMSDDGVLGPILDVLWQNPADERTAAQLAALVHTSERTLIRKFDRLLGLSLREWRQRLKVVKAFALLESGQAVESIALDLGYNSASAFIVMFRNQVGMTPEQWRLQRA